MARKSVGYWAPSATQTKASTRNEAALWGRVAARLGWGLSDLPNEVDPQYHEVARQAYSKAKQA